MGSGTVGVWPLTASEAMKQGRADFHSRIEALSPVLNDLGSRLKGTCMEGVAVLGFAACFAL